MDKRFKSKLELQDWLQTRLNIDDVADADYAAYKLYSKGYNKLSRLLGLTVQELIDYVGIRNNPPLVRELSNKLLLLQHQQRQQPQQRLLQLAAEEKVSTIFQHGANTSDGGAADGTVGIFPQSLSAMESSSSIIQKQPQVVPTLAAASKRRDNNNSNSDHSSLATTSFFLSSKQEFLSQHFLPFLSINETTKLSQTCRRLRKIVHSSRHGSSSYPYIIWEERRPTKLGYDYLSRGTSGSGDYLIIVSQIQPFRFIWQTAVQSYMKVDFSLINMVWDEQNGYQDGPHCRGLHHFPCKTKPYISIMHSDQEWQDNPLFCVQPSMLFAFPNEVRRSGPTVLLPKHWPGSEQVPDEMDACIDLVQRIAMDFAFKCAQRIAVYPGGRISYPSAEYLMQQFPDNLHSYFPPTLAGMAEGLDDRETVVEFSYRPAPTLAEWKAIYKRGRAIIELDEVPYWYRDGYSWISGGQDSTNAEENNEDTMSQS